MRERIEPSGVRSTINIHLADKGRAWSQAYPEQGRAVIALETTTTTVTLLVNAQNLDRMRRVINNVQAALPQNPPGRPDQRGSAGKAA